VAYTKDSEGATYNDATTGSDRSGGDGGDVPTGSTHTYTWEVPERSGPGPMDGSSAAWMYHSHTDEIADVYAGLTGFLVVTARAKARSDATPVDVDREVFSLFEVDNENSSPFIDENTKRFVAGPALTPERFTESNLMHSINGYLYGGGPVVTMHRGERVRWYLMSMGTEVDLHTPHWHGNTAVVAGMRTDVVNLLPAGMITADLIPDRAGIWLFHCHVGDHLKAGMLARYRVD
jgi:hephaestin